MRTYFNTTQVTIQQEIEFTAVTLKQGEIILSVFAANKNRDFTPYEVDKILKDQGHSVLITSIRRSINTLTKLGELVKTDEQRKGDFKAPNCTWKYNLNKQNT